MGRVSDKVVIVTGGTSGIGEATCLLLAQEGATVAVTERNEERGKKVVDMILRNGGKAHFWQLDVSKEAEVEEVINSIVSLYGKIDGLVNNAGISGSYKNNTGKGFLGGPRIHELSEAEWNEVQDINVKGVFFCTKHVIPHLLKNGGGSIVNVSSIAGLGGQNGLPHYSASKGAVRLMTKADALDYVHDNIRVNSVHPGLTWTNMFERSAINGVTKEAISARILKNHPFVMQRFAESIEIAQGILFLISDESSIMTGSELVMDGGRTAGG
jgi:NAD(P)-dependent dehydrogenase (short-subunit alcohol dehydrogenase family)